MSQGLNKMVIGFTRVFNVDLSCVNSKYHIMLCVQRRVDGVTCILKAQNIIDVNTYENTITKMVLRNWLHKGIQC